MKERKLDFAVIGGEKCGTSALSDYFSRHDSINFCTLKEPGFFSRSSRLNLKKIEEYNALFEEKDGLRGETSPSYAFPEYLPETARRLFEHNPQMKIILVVRNPLKRVVSHLNHSLLRRETSKSDLLLEVDTPDSLYVRRSKFGIVAKHFMDFFPKENFKIINFEDLILGKIYKDLSIFLDIPYDSSLELREVNKTNKRYKNTKLTKYYKENWHLFNKVPIPKPAKVGVKKVTDVLFSSKLSDEEKVELRDLEDKNLHERFIQDDLLFKQLTGFSYLELNK